MDKYRKFREDGYLVLKNVFTEKEINNLRHIAYDLFKNKVSEEKQTSSDRSLYTNTFLDNPQLINHLFKETVTGKLKKIFGDDYVTFIQFSLTSNIHDPTWHTDSQSQGPAEYLFDSSYNIAKCGLYLQKDDETFGGQMEVIPKSHKPSLLGYRSFIGRDKMYGRVSKIQSLAYSLKNRFLKKIRLSIEVGDVLVFHSHLWHRASQPNWKKLSRTHTHGIHNPPKEKNKYMIQWEISENNKFAKVYATHQELRAENSNNPLFIESNKAKFESLDKSTLDIVKDNECNIRSYSEMSLRTETNNLRSNHGTPIVFLKKQGN